MGDHILGNLGSLTTIYWVGNDGFELVKHNFSGGLPLFIEIDTIFNKIDLTFSRFRNYINKNSIVIFALAFAALCTYGFELFNFNITIDEEIHASYPGIVSDWVPMGRWGMYLLNRLLFPHTTVIPFVPLFFGLVFHVGAILLMLSAWNVKLIKDQILVGFIGITFPTMAYMYSFSIINYGIGFGYFCIGLSLFVYAKNNNRARFVSILPAALAIAIYPGFIPALVSAFLIFLINKWIGKKNISKDEIFDVSGIIIGAIILYFIIHKSINLIVTVPLTYNVSQYFNIDHLLNDFSSVLIKTLGTAKQAYLGEKTIYAISITSLTYLLGLSLIGLGINLFGLKTSSINKTILALLSVSLLFLPFAAGLLMRGIIQPRFMLALPIVCMGIILLGINKNRLFQVALVLFSTLVFIQFITATNHLFASSHLALQSDRLVASQLIERIESAKAEVGTTNVNYLEVVGYYSRPSTLLIPKTGTIGASFFEWDQGNIYRVVAFLRTLGYEDLVPLPVERRIKLIDLANSMPVWPEKGSVKIIEDIVLVKFGPYSYRQKLLLCQPVSSQAIVRDSDFCK